MSKNKDNMNAARWKEIKAIELTERLFYDSNHLGPYKKPVKINPPHAETTTKNN